MGKVSVLQAGFARVDITPDYPVSLSGYGNDETRIHQTIRDRIYLECIAITGSNDTILLMFSDTLSVNDALAETLRGWITPATGIPGDKIFFSASHSHSGPLLYGNFNNVDRYRRDYCAHAVEAAREALADRASARMFTGCKRLPGMNFIRHYLTEDGTYYGDNFGDKNLACVGHVGMTDPRMLLLHLKREEKADIVIMNWQAHNDIVGNLGQPVMSASYTGCIREHFEKLTGMHFAFLAGASGNQARYSRVAGESHGLTWIEYSHSMAEHAAQFLAELIPQEDTEIRTLRVSFAGEVDHSWDSMVPQAQEVFDLWKRENKKAGDALGKTYGFSSCYQTCAILYRAKQGPTEKLELNAFRIGQIAFITGTFEMFSDMGIYVRDYAPYDTVFICTGNNTYVPSARSYDYRSYEADTSRFAKGTCEKISREYVKMLEQLK